MRRSADVTFMQIAQVLAWRSTCSRAAVGAIVVSSDGLQILGIGYNGSPRGTPHCSESAVLSALPGACGCIHAELNAILKAPGTTPGLTLYTTTMPCLSCARLILNTGIVRVVASFPYRDDAGWRLLTERGITVEVVQADL